MAVILCSAHPRNVMIRCVDTKWGKNVPFAVSKSHVSGGISPGIAPPNSCPPTSLRFLKMNCKIILLGPHVGVMPMIERFFTIWPGSGPLCVKTWIDPVALAAVSDTFGYLRHPVVQPIIIPAETSKRCEDFKEKEDRNNAHNERVPKERKGKTNKKKLI